MQPFYVHSKGWYILRPKDAVLAAKMAERMTAACNNKNIGYDQGQPLRSYHLWNQYQDKDRV